MCDFAILNFSTWVRSCECKSVTWAGGLVPVRGVDPGFASRPAALERSDVVVGSVQRKVNGAAVYLLPKKGDLR